MTSWLLGNLRNISQIFKTNRREALGFQSTYINYASKCGNLCNYTSKIQGCQKCTSFLWGQKWNYLWSEPLCFVLLKPFCTVNTLLLRSSTFNNFQHLYCSSIFCIFLSPVQCCAVFCMFCYVFSHIHMHIQQKNAFLLSFILFLTYFYLILCLM